MVSIKDNRQLNYCIGLGSNIGDRENLLVEACKLLGQKAGSIEKVSSVYLSEPWGNDELKPFLNMALIIQSRLHPLEVLKICQSIEDTLGRTRVAVKMDYIDRTIDIDILLCDQNIIEHEFFTVPHPHLAKRNFVLEPLVEIAGSWIHPELNKSIKELKLMCDDHNMVKRSKPPLIKPASNES